MISGCALCDYFDHQAMSLCKMMKSDLINFQGNGDGKAIVIPFLRLYKDSACCHPSE